MSCERLGLALLAPLVALTADRADAYYPANAKATGQIFCLLGEGPAAAPCPPSAPRMTTAPGARNRRCEACNAAGAKPATPGR